MSLDIKVHDAQTAILRELLFQPHAGFAQKQKPTGLTSDHFNFHITRLVELGLVEKIDRGQYTLTHKGKEYANKMDTDNNTIERQPKVAVCLVVHDGQGRTLMQQRLKQPYYGYWGRPTGKIRWGETIMQAAARELKEETNLEATFVMRGIYHKMDYNDATKALLEDKIFFMMHATNPTGELFIDFEGGRNQWMTDDEIMAQERSFVNLKDGTVTTEKSAGISFIEKDFFYAPADY
jgi:ADP-ribose pyrophosphatase YjhB (NUDIX family)